jgi:DNA-directed RNA polymerase specialized sigma24 family protein
MSHENDLYKEVAPSLQALACSFTNRGIDLDDLIAETNLVFVRILRDKTYKKKRASFRTYVCRCAWNKLRDICLSHHKRRELEERQKEHLKHMSPNQTTQRLITIIDSMTSDCQTVVKLILDTPSDIKLLTQTGIRSHLKAKGWNRRQIKKVMDKLSEIVTHELI